MFEFDIINISVIFVAIANLLFGALLFMRNKSNATNIAFFLVTVSVALWGMSMFSYRGFQEEGYVLLLTHLLYFSATLIPLAFLFFSYIFPESESNNIIRRKWLYAIPFFIIAIISLLPNTLILSVDIQENGEHIIYFNHFYNFLYGFYIIGYFSKAYYNLIVKFFSFEKRYKIQIVYILLGTFISTLISLTTNLIMPFFGYFLLNWFGQVATIVMVVACAWAIIKHNLFNVRLLTVEFLTLFIGTIIIARFVLSEDLLQYFINGALFIFTIIFGYTIMRNVTHDIELRKIIEHLVSQRTIANNRLELLDRQKSEFVSIASHQLRTPLTAIKGYASMVLEGSFGEIPKKTVEPVQRIFKSSQKLVMIIENFLTISRIEQGRMIYRFETVDLEKEMKAITDELRLAIEQKNLKLHITVPKGKKFLVHADKIKVKQVIHNLLSNSIKHTNKGFIDIIISSPRMTDTIRLTISDTGRGLSGGEVKSMFERRDMDIDESAEVQDETGVELFISREMVKAQRGKLWVESEGVGHGITFFLELPEMLSNTTAI